MLLICCSQYPFHISQGVHQLMISIKYRYKADHLKQQQMGNTTTQPSSEFYLKQWQTIDHLDNCNIVRNIKTNELGQSRKYLLDPIYDPQDQLKIYDIRGRAEEPIVRVYSAGILEKVSRKMDAQGRTGICGSTHHIGVVTQRIPYTLDDLPQLTFPQCLKILEKSLQGYQSLYPRSGPVHITPKMIGLNNRSQIKVWINQNFSLNHPNTQIRSLLSTRNQKLDREYNLITPQFRDEKEMVENVVDVVEDYCENGMYNGEFHTEVRENCQSFRHALAYISDYIQAHNIWLPTKILPNSVYIHKHHHQHQHQSQPQLMNAQLKNPPVRQHQDNPHQNSLEQIVHSLRTPYSYASTVSQSSMVNKNKKDRFGE